MTITQELKQPIRAWLKKYPDDRLGALLAHAQDGKLSFWSCCCLVGSMVSNHSLHGYMPEGIGDGYRNSPAAKMVLAKARAMVGAREAENAFGRLGELSVIRGAISLDADHRSGLYMITDLDCILREGDAIRRRILIPMIRTEQWLRERVRLTSDVKTPVAALVG